MDYEGLFTELQPLCKDLKDRSNVIQRMVKSIAKDMETGNLKGVLKSLDTISETAAALSDSTNALKGSVSSFDAAAYFNDGDFTRQMLDSCKEREIDVIGESPVFEMFPYRVRIDAENQEVYLDRRKITTMRPKALVDTIAASREKLMKAPFNAQKFADELADAYDTAVLKMNKRPGTDVYLTNVYKMMVPMGRFRRDYDQYNFAFDIARLYDSDIEMTKSGRRWQFGSSRKMGKAIRILDMNGNEQFFATIKFFDPED